MSIAQVTKGSPLFGENEGVWEYKDINNEFLCFIVRKSKNGKKFFTPWTFQQDKWVTQWFKDKDGESLQRPLYRLNTLKQSPDKPVLLVEGEKTADSGAKLFPEFNVISWMGGAQIIKKVDIAPLENKIVYLLPDNDDAGYSAMNLFRERLTGFAHTVIGVDIKALGVAPKWDLADLNDDYGEVEFEDVRRLVHDSKPHIKIAGVIAPETFPIKTSKGNPLNTYENLDHICKHHGINPRFDVIRKEIIMTMPHKNFTLANKAKLELAELTSLCIKNNMPRADLVQWLTMIADNNSFNPVEVYITSKPWDGVSRITEFMNTIDCVDNKLRDIYIRRWMIGTVAVGLSKTGLAHPGVLTFISKQAKGKSSWVRNLLPEDSNLFLGEFILNPDDKDSIIRATKHWIVELAEADATVKRSESSAQKAFLTRRMDLYRCPYDKSDTEAPRHTAFFGSVNDTQFLKDETGNRRWWILEVNEINYDHGLDMQQIWAEFKLLLDSGEQFHLTKTELDTLMGENESFRSMSSIEEKIRLRYDWISDYRIHKLTAIEVLEECDFDVKNNRQNMTKEANRILRELTGERPKKVRGVYYYSLPRVLLNNSSF